MKMVAEYPLMIWPGLEMSQRVRQARSDSRKAHLSMVTVKATRRLCTPRRSQKKTK